MRATSTAVLCVALLFSQGTSAQDSSAQPAASPLSNPPFVPDLSKPSGDIADVTKPIVIGSSHDNNNNNNKVNAHNKLGEKELGFIDSVFGDGMQSRVVSGVTEWISGKVKSNPVCVERFVCESYRAGENMTGIPYFLMQVTNAAVSFVMADMFEGAVKMEDLTRAARIGRTDTSCVNMKCEVMDGQLRTIGDFLGAVEDFFSSVFSSVSNSINLG